MVLRRFLTPGWLFGHVLVTAAVLLCLRLAWWQLDRSHESDGGAQNFGYALLWPLFGAAFVYMWVKFIRLELIRDNEIETEHAENVSLMLAAAEEMTAAASRTLGAASTVEPGETAETTPLATVSPAPEVGSETKSDLRRDQGPDDIYDHTHLDENEDAGLIAYNRALAALAEQDQRRAR